MQLTVRWRISLPVVPFSRVAASSLLVAWAAALLSGCSAGAEDMPTVAVPVDESPSGRPDPALNLPGRGDSDDLVVSGRQRAYLDALGSAGVHPSSELLALSIGTYVCQARAAGQGDQAVWDFVVPLVRGDVRDAHPMPRSDSSIDTLAAEVDEATGDYIRVATEQLC